MKPRSGSGFAAACALVTALVVGVPAASALVVHTPNGHFLGIAPHRGVAAVSIPGSIAAQHKANLSSNGTLSFHNGPVVHSSTAYLVFWAPSGFSIQQSSQALLGRYLTDAAADSGKPNNVYGVARQFTDASGFADYSQAFSAGAQAISDTQTYPALDSANCPKSLSIETYCLTDAQIEAELQRLIASQHLPDDGPASSTGLPANAPIYFMVLPPTVNVCDSGGCVDTQFCSYHSVFTNTSGHEVLYAAVPFLATSGGLAKLCQSDGNSVVQQPNRDPADVALKFLSHEHNEVLTDPLGTAWFDSSSGNEDGDNCNQYAPTANPANGTSPHAFTPVIAGNAPQGTLYNQLIAGDPYYLQSEWSNGDIGCEMAPTGGTIVPRFTSPSSNIQGTPASFDPSASTSTNPLSSATWDFGDSSAPAFRGGSSSLANVSHTYSLGGTYTVKLTLVDNRGNLATTTQQVTVDEAPTAAFTSTPLHPAVGQPVSFDGSSSSDPDGSIMSYSWKFGDGASGSGATPTHSYVTSGIYTITLKVTDSSGATATTTQQLPLGLIASFTVTSPPPLLQGQAVSFDGTGSSTSQGATITSYSWDFGDGSAPGAGPTPSHAYLHYGSYIVKLTITDSSGAQAATAQTVVVHEHLPIASFVVPTAFPMVGQSVAFDGSSSSDPDGPITSYSWTFGDGTTGTGATPSHVYASYGAYSVTLTVTDGDGQTASATQQIVVHALPVARFAVLTSGPTAGQPVAFDGSASSDPTASIVSYVWTFGDGGAGTGATPRHTYTSYSTYTVTLTVTDSNGLTNTVSQQVVVHDAPFAAFTFTPRRPVEGAVVGFDASSSGDPEPGASIVSYKWSFGDGGVAAGVRPRHVYRRAGTFLVALTATNALGGSATSYQDIRVAPARITRVSLRSVPGGAALLVVVNAAGVVSDGRNSIRIRHPGTVRVRITLDAAQTSRLSSHQPVNVPLKLRYVPHAGRTSRMTLTITFFPPSRPGHRFNARLQR
ncbi:MAG: PKD domain-containing protein [Actinomycetota bacterium]|nr:PKD domain-containing protein [Actinomycetota bacterium]